DGTLIKAGGAGLRGLNLAIKDMCGVDDICSKFQLQGSTDKENFRTAFIQATGRKPTARQVSEMERRYVAYLPTEVAKSIKSKNYFKVRGAEKLLKTLCKCKDVMVGLGTGNLKEGAFIKLKPSGLIKYFAFGGYGCDSHIRSRMLMKAVERAGKLLKTEVNPGDVYVIGDTHKDIEAAKEAGYHSAGVTCGFGEAAALARSGPELLAKDFSNPHPWLLWLGLVKDPKGVRRGTYICPDSPIEHAHYGRTGLDQKDIESAMKKLKKAKKK
ncbi:MAG: hypothetical protein A3J79_09770, partial [Elusimicrobia bacterium RIFOXYB2_FULL_62_6]